MAPGLPPFVQAYAGTISRHGAASLIALFAGNGVVDDIGRSFSAWQPGANPNRDQEGDRVPSIRTAVLSKRFQSIADYRLL
jgi:hypothetical protein